ncbi:MAG: aminotransferase class I/II-fold pyridoxal phosphate-dependent enzyme [Alphaproteobacteria bacterium]|nr:aminotransferase class I/II-fold pyridoxal phosphate-dependent enzyme [Alphaproteobacteria bacterium]
MRSMDFHRIKLLPPYVFAEVNAMKAKARAAGQDIIDLGMGNPDTGTPRHIVDKLVEAAQNPRAHRYSASRGITGLRKAIAAYYGRRFGVDIDPETETCVTIGSKEGLATLASAMTGPGDSIVTPDPSYPIHAHGFLIVGAEVVAIRQLPGEDPSLPSGRDFMEGFKKTVETASRKPLAVILSYPSNPTAQIVGLDFYGEMVDFCRHHKIYILSDIAYSEIYFNDMPPPSVLQIPKAREIAIEFTSMSKTYSMPGWRIGFGTGNKDLVRALTKIKSWLDYGAFTPIQVAAAAALNGPQDCVAHIRQLYQGRRDVLVQSMAAAGWDIPSPPASMFAWAPLPKGFRHLTSLEFSKLLLTEAQLAVSPGAAFGASGEGFIRIALVENEQRIRQAARVVKKFLSAGAPEVKPVSAEPPPARKAANR